MKVSGWLVLWDGREVELPAGADTVMGRGSPLLGISDKRCSRRQAVLTFLPPATPSDPPFALVAHGPNTTYVRRQGAEEREGMVKGEVYFLHDGDVIRLPPDYHPIVLRLVGGGGGGEQGQEQEQTQTRQRRAAPAGHHAVAEQAVMPSLAEVKESQQEETLIDRRQGGEGRKKGPRRWMRDDAPSTATEPGDQREDEESKDAAREDTDTILLSSVSDQYRECIRAVRRVLPERSVREIIAALAKGQKDVERAIDLLVSEAAQQPSADHPARLQPPLPSSPSPPNVSPIRKLSPTGASSPFRVPQGVDQAPKEARIEDLAPELPEGAEEGERAGGGGRLLGLLPDFRPLSMWWQAGSPASGDGSAVPPSEGREDTVMETSGSSTRPGMSAEVTRLAEPPPTSGWIRRKRKSDDIRPGRANEDAALDEAREGAQNESTRGEENEKEAEEETEVGLTRKKRRTVSHTRDHDDDGEEPKREPGKEKQSSGDECTDQLEARPDAPDRDTEAPAGAVARGEAADELPPSGDGDVAVLQAMFEGVEEDELRKVLRENGGDVNQAIDSLLNLIAIRNGEAGSLSLDHREEVVVEAREMEAHREASHSENVNNEDEDEDPGMDIARDMELGENEERIVDTMKDAIVEALAESYLRKKGLIGEDDMEEEEAETDAGIPESGEGARDWPCPVCTFINQAADDSCLMCGHSIERATARGKSEADAPVHRSQTGDDGGKGKEKMDEEHEEVGSGAGGGAAEAEKKVVPRSEEEEREEEERRRKEEAEKKEEAERQRREKLDKEDEAREDMSPGWTIRKGLAAGIERLYGNSQGLTVLPRQVGRFRRLTMLNLDHNQLEWLPAEIGDLAALQGLFVNHNQLKRFPPELGKLTNLTWLRASHNQLDGLVDGLAGLVGLQHLDLAHNQLTQLPPWLSALPRLALLDLGHNQVAHIPPTLFVAEESLPALSVLNLDHNPLRCVPYSLHHRRLISVRLAGCQFDELHRSIKWTDSNYHVLRCEEGPAAVVSLFDQCLTYLHRTEKESIDEWGLPEQITTYLWRNVDRCIGCTRTFVGKGVGEIVEKCAVGAGSRYGESAAATQPLVRGRFCSLACGHLHPYNLTAQKSQPVHDTSSG